MGQYHKVVNLTKKEFFHPHTIGLGMKAVEQLSCKGSSGDILFALTMSSNGQGGGDLNDHDLIGRWAGDEIAAIGDYCDTYHYPVGTFDGYTDISLLVRDMLSKCFNILVVGPPGVWARRHEGTHNV